MYLIIIFGREIKTYMLGPGAIKNLGGIRTFIQYWQDYDSSNTVFYFYLSPNYENILKFKLELYTLSFMHLFWIMKIKLCNFMADVN